MDVKNVGGTPGGLGEFVIGFSNANSVPRETRKMVYRMKVLLDRSIERGEAARFHARSHQITHE